MLRVLCGSLAARTCALAAFCLSAAVAAPARAWTNTELTGADAHVHVWPSGLALVSLTLELTVRGGWLSRFEIAGLDPGARLDPDKPPSVLCEDGRKVAPRAELRPDGTLVLEFDRARAPRRGRHRLDLIYSTRMAASDAERGARTMSWSMPAWRVDLADVDLWINAPAGARLRSVEQGELEGAVSRRQLARGERTVLHLHRVQLPRTLPFGFEIELPAGSAPGGAVPARLARAPVRALNPSPPPPFWLGASVIALAWLKRWSVRARCRRRGGRATPLLALPARARLGLTLAFGLAGSLCYLPSPPLGLVLLGAVVALALDARVAAAHAWRRRARSRGGQLFDRLYDLFGPTSWLDATTPSGALLLASAYALAVARLMLGGGLGPWLELLLLVTPLWSTATRLHARVRPAAAAAARQTPAPTGSGSDSAAAPGVAFSSNAGADRRAPDRAA